MQYLPIEPVAPVDVQLSSNEPDCEPDSDILCPICKAQWSIVRNERHILPPNPCPHLKFIWSEYEDFDGVLYYNGFTKDQLSAGVIASVNAMNPSNFEDYKEDDPDFEPAEEHYIEEFLFATIGHEHAEKITILGVDAIYTLNIDGMGCGGPYSATILYGVQRNP
jgi:hypothetical protein